jgi:hypothetical protein
MDYIIILFATAIIVAGIIILIHPETIFGLLRRKSESLSLHILAVVVRLIIGVALILGASESRYPSAISTIGWISIVAASVLAIIGRSNFKRLMSWMLSFSPAIGRIGGVLAMLLGGFLIYAVI